jgi:hypothetical protein
MRQELTTDHVSRHIEATPEALYDLVADVTRTPEIAPEIESCEWLGGATGPAVGARFKAVNRAGRGPSWNNKPVVVAAERGREFAFDRTEPFAGTIRWRYQFDSDGTGTLVTESYDVTHPLSIVGWFIIDTLYGLKDRKGDLHTSMVATLERLAALTESPVSSRPSVE